jgi:protein-S-isoprenylcysteine O-methyltransferase Ste14
MIIKKSKAAQVWFFPPYLVVFSLILSFALEYLFSSYPIIDVHTIQRITGVSIIILSIFIFVKSLRIFSSNLENLHPRSISTQIFKDGPFKFSRNPIYLAMVLLIFGFGISLNSMWFLIIGLIDMILLHYGIILPEEIYLEKEFGKDYLNYKSSVRRWL